MDHHDILDESLQDFDLPPSPSRPHHSVHRSEAALTEGDLEDSEIASAGGYSPPAWRRLGNGNRSSGFWRGPEDFPSRGMSTLMESTPELEDSEDDGVLERAIRTRLPKGSQSPEKGRSVSPGLFDDTTIQFQLQERATPIKDLSLHEPPPPSDNCK
jgi:hypothetical protein